MKRIVLLLVCLLVFLALVGGGAAWMYFSPNGPLAPTSSADAVQALLESRSSADWREDFDRLTSIETTEFENSADIVDDLFTAAASGNSFSFREDSESSTRTAPVYILSAGDTDVLRLVCSYDSASRTWNVESAALPELSAEARTLTVTVPEGTAVSVNGIALSKEYITDSNVPYDNITELESRFDFCPHRVTYSVPGIYEAVSVDVEREGGVLVLSSDGTNWDCTVPDAAGYAFRLTAPQEASVTAGGVPLGEEQVVSHETLPTHVDIPEELSGSLPVYTVYAAGGLYSIPEFTATMPDGTVLQQTTDTDGNPSFELPGDEALYDECHERVEEYLREVAEYGAGHTAYHNPNAYVVSGTSLSDYFRYAIDSLHWTVGVSLEFGDVTSWGYVPLGESAFLCEAQANFTTKTNYQTKDITVNYELLWVNLNGTWYIQDMSFL